MPYHGVRMPELRRLLKPLIAKHPFTSADDLRDTVLALWRRARFREERYAAIELCEAKAYDDYQTLELLAMYEEMITTGAWWDLVDPIASHRLGRLLEKFPRRMTKIMLAWSRTRLGETGAMWKRRSAIICQLTRRGDTDLSLLYRTIEPNLASREFFIRKAIGWALRHYGWTDPEEVVRYVAANEGRLSALSRREALRSVDKARARIASKSA